MRLNWLNLYLLCCALFLVTQPAPAHADAAKYQQYTEATCILIANEITRYQQAPSIAQAKQLTYDRHCQAPVPYTPKANEVRPAAIVTTRPPVPAAERTAQSPVAHQPQASERRTPAMTLQDFVLVCQRKIQQLMPAVVARLSPPLQLALLALVLVLLMKIFASLLFAMTFGNSVWLGRVAEKQLARLLRKTFGRQPLTYQNIVLPTPQGDWTEIDQLLLTPYGIFVLEVKNYRGWIFGSPDQPKWTVQHFRRKHQFMNPLHQNAKHCRAVASLLSLPLAQIRSVVAFSRRARFKTVMPDNVMHIDQVPRYISLTGSLQHPLTEAELALYKTQLDHFASQAKQLRKVHLAQFEPDT